MNLQQAQLTQVRAQMVDRAVVFLHGFTGDRDDTWDRFPGLLGAAVDNLDIFTLGFPSTLLPDIGGVWSADPDLPLIAASYGTELGIPPLQRYKKLALVAHSMGGLALQRLLLDRPDVVARATHVVLFGTPSDGLAKAGWFRFWKRQLQNMSIGSSFIVDVRKRWKEQFGTTPPFELMVVAGNKDQFVPPASSLEPFDRKFQQVVTGDHVQIVKPASADATSVRLLVAALSGSLQKPTTKEVLQHAAEAPPGNVIALVQSRDAAAALSEADIVDAALALERAGKRAESIAFLEKHQHVGPDAQGALAGRIKRMWLQEGNSEHASRALDLYRKALAEVVPTGNHEQIYYHAINVAFMGLVAFDDSNDAQRSAEVALAHAALSPVSVWSVATRAEAQLYLGRREQALASYRELSAMETEPWKVTSAIQQAFQLARYKGDQEFANELDALFSPGAHKIFISYSHDDSVWLDRLTTTLAPYISDRNSELDVWDDRRLEVGDRWREEIDGALSRCGVAVLLVSPKFLASKFIRDHELPTIIDRAKSANLRLIWVAVKPAGYDATKLKDFQAANDPAKPLNSLADHEVDKILLDVARSIKHAALEPRQHVLPRGAEC